MSGLKEINQYRYRLRASNAEGKGSWSDVITVATTSIVLDSKYNIMCDHYYDIGPPYSSKSLHKAVQQGDAELVVSILKSKYVTMVCKLEIV